MLVKSDVTEYELYNHTGEQTIVSKNSYFVTDGKVSRLSSIKKTGINKHSGKRWYRWESAGGSCVYRTKRDTIAGFQKGGRSFNGLIPFYTIERDAEYRALVQDYVGEVTFRNVYPCAQYWPFNDQMSLPMGIRGAFKEKDLKDFSINLFGKTRYRKPLNRALGTAVPYAISVAHDFRGLVPIDWIIDFLRLNPFDEDTDRLREIQIGTIRPILMTLDPRSYRHLLREPLTHQRAFGLADVSRMVVQDARRFNRPIQPIHGRAKAWDDIHDLAFPDRGQYRYRVADRADVGPRVAYVPRPQRSDIPLTKLGERVKALKVEGLEIVLPTETKQLVEWGREMHNCIGGYGYAVAQDNATRLLGAIYKDKKLIANFEVDNGTLRQLLGKFNRAIPNEDRKKMEKAFQSVGVKTGHYWGLDGDW